MTKAATPQPAGALEAAPNDTCHKVSQSNAIVYIETDRVTGQKFLCGYNLFHRYVWVLVSLQLFKSVLYEILSNFAVYNTKFR